MNAEPHLMTLAKIFNEFRFEPVMIGNAAAALNGAPVTTMDIDFVIEQTPENYRKIMAIAAACHWKVYELKLKNSDKYMYRLQNDEGTFFLDILHSISGFQDLHELRKNANKVKFGKHFLKVASLKDILHSKKTANRSKDLAVIEILEETQYEIENRQKNNKK